MRKLNIFRNIICLYLLGMMTTSCSKDNEQISSNSNDLVNVEFNVMKSGYTTSRASDNSTEQGKIGKFRVLVYDKQSNGEYIFEKDTLFDEEYEVSDTKPYMVKVKPGTKRFYFFANEDMVALYKDLETAKAGGNEFKFTDEEISKDDLEKIVLGELKSNIDGNNTFTSVYDISATSPTETEDGGNNYNPQDEEWFFPMTGMTESVINRTLPDVVQNIQMKRAISKVTFSIYLKTGFDASNNNGMGDKKFSIEYIILGTNPTFQYFLPQEYTASDGNKYPGALPSYTNADFNYVVTYKPTSVRKITEGNKEIPIAVFYLHENPFGANYKDGIITDTKHYEWTLNGKSYDFPSVMRIFYNYKKEATDADVPTGVTKNISFLERNADLQIVATADLSTSASETQIYLYESDKWLERTENIPTYE